MLLKNKLFYILCFLFFLTSSFDIFLTVNIGGFTFRFCQLVGIILMILAITKMLRSGKLKLPIGIGAALLWMLVLIFATFNTPLISMNVAYHIWLIYNLLIIFSFVNLIDEESNFNTIFRLYLLSFFLIAVFGVIQFICPFIGINPPFITQWWIRGKLARVNGFTYEPSYYATYLLIGWILFRILFKYSKTLFICYRKKISSGLLFVTLAILLSSSRMGLAMLVLFEILNLLYEIIILKKKFSKKFVFNGLLIFGTCVTVLLIVNKYFYNLTFLLQGTGLFGTSNHSFFDRFKGLTDTLIVFTKSPLLGYGLGGVYTVVAQFNNVDIYTTAVQETGSVLCVFAEVLAGTGIIGFIFFIKYIYDIISKPIKYSLKKLTGDKKIIMIALVISLIFELIILQFNQNILRIYLWINIAIVSMAYSVFVGGKQNEK